MAHCNHVWRPYADDKKLWQVCDKCGYTEDIGTHQQIQMDRLAYIFGLRDEPNPAEKTGQDS